ncbi:MAG: tyrosine-type recombinase/integrase [Bacilli bacterium]
MTNDLLKVKDLLKMRGCSDRTVNNYLSCINRFKKYYNEKEDLKNLKENDILDYLKVNFIDLDFSAASININRAAIKYYYLVNFEIDFNKTLLPSCKIKNRFPVLISKEQIINMINSENNIKHKLWLILGYGSGLRVSEVSALKVSDILTSEHKMRIIGKGNKERYVPLPDYTLKLLRNYWILNNKNITTDYLFPGIFKKTKCSHISSTTVQEAFQKIKINNKLDSSISFHTLRHSFATEYIKSGGDIWELRALLGHSSINSTMLYLHMAEDFSKVKSPLDGVK